MISILIDLIMTLIEKKPTYLTISLYQ